MNETTKGTWGGAREGSGRRNGDRQHCLYVRVSEEALKKLDGLTKNRSQFIDELLLSL